MKTRILLSVIYFLACLFVSTAESEESMSYIDNGTIRLGVDLSLGGAVTFLKGPGSDENMINSFDWGRQIQMSFYSGPNPFAPDGFVLSSNWKGLGWNPIQSGDCYSNRSKVIEHMNDGSSIYVKSIPMIWPLENYPGECTFETWYVLNGNTVEVKSRINNNRPDRTQYQGRGQELPAIYTNGRWYKMVAYMGDKPFSGAPVTTLVDMGDGKGWPWRNFYSPENWVALLDKDDTGVGIFEPDVFTFAGGYAGKPKGSGGAKDMQTGYMSPVQPEILDHNIVYDYNYILILGNLREIRDYVYKNKPERKLPVWRFDKDRRHWYYSNTTDAGWPISGEICVNASPSGAAVVRSPSTYWVAEDAPVLYVDAAFNDVEGKVKVHLEKFGANRAGDWPQWGPEKEKTPPEDVIGPVEFAISNDGNFKIYEVDLTKTQEYHGAMTGLRLTLPLGKGRVRIRSIGFEPIAKR